MDSTTKPPRPQRNRWFVFNVVALCILAPWATYWFQEHLQLYFTEIVVIGGAISLWVLLRGMWAVLEKAGKVDVWEHSRKLLSLPDITGLLAVGIVVFLLLWFHTASLYIQFHGAPGEGDYVVEVVRTADNSPFIARTHLNAEHAVIGTPVLWQRDPVALQCRILEPVKYQAIPCDLRPRQSTRIQVPGSFPQKEFHLLRLIPSGALYRELARTDETPTSRFDLEIQRGNERTVVQDLRRQVVYTGAPAHEMPILMGLETTTSLEQHLRWQLLARNFDNPTMEMTTAVLISSTRQMPSMTLKRGDRIMLRVIATQTANGAKNAAPQTVFTLPYLVTDEKVQSLWLSSN